MSGEFDVKTKRKIMAAIKGKCTSVETLVFKYLRKEERTTESDY